MWRVKEESSGTAGFLMGRWWCHQLSLGVHGGKLICWLGKGLGRGEKEGSGWSYDEFKSGNVMNLFFARLRRVAG